MALSIEPSIYKCICLFEKNLSTTTSLSSKLFELKIWNIKPSIKFKNKLASGFNE